MSINVNAETYWNVWRNIMRNKELQNIIFDNTESLCDLSKFSSSKEETQAILDYKKESERAKWFIVNYRYRLTNSVINALESGGAQLTLRYLIAVDGDLNKLSENFLNSVGWKDYGPYVYTYCNDVLSFLLENENINDSFRDLINLEKEIVSLMLNYEHQTSKNNFKDKNIYKTKKARCYNTSYNISSWLKNKSSIGRSELKHCNENYLMYIPDLTSAHKFVLIPQRVADIYSVIEYQPSSIKEVSSRLEDDKKECLTIEDDKYLDLLVKYNSIVFDE